MIVQVYHTIIEHEGLMIYIVNTCTPNNIHINYPRYPQHTMDTLSNLILLNRQNRDTTAKDTPRADQAVH
jgi:hypothetical protein